LVVERDNNTQLRFEGSYGLNSLIDWLRNVANAKDLVDILSEVTL